jgi:hypothetical protein
VFRTAGRIFGPLNLDLSSGKLVYRNENLVSFLNDHDDDEFGKVYGSGDKNKFRLEM